MMTRSLSILFIFLSFGVHSLFAGHTCQPSYTTFTPSTKSQSISQYNSRSIPNTPFLAISPQDSYAVTEHGLELYLSKPNEPVKTYPNGTNSRLGSDATVNSTFIFPNARTTFEISVPTVPGAVLAAIMIDGTGASSDEIDIEILGSQPKHWQTNIFAPSKQDRSPHYGEFSLVESFNENNPGDISVFHNYYIDWNKERIVWGVDDEDVRTVEIESTRKNGVLHYPTHDLRLQIGIWDGSGAPGTSEWAGGPINWSKAPDRITGIIKSIRVECEMER